MKRLIAIWVLAATMMTAATMPAEAQTSDNSPNVVATINAAVKQVADSLSSAMADSATVMAVKGSIQAAATATPSHDDYEESADDDQAKYDFVLRIMFIVFVAAPLCPIAVLSVFAYMIRKQKMDLISKALEQGRPLPSDMMESKLPRLDRVWRRGITWTSIGVGLIVFSILMESIIGIGLSAIVAIYGVGQIVIVRTSPEWQSWRKGNNGDEPTGNITEQDEAQ